MGTVPTTVREAGKSGIACIIRCIYMSSLPTEDVTQMLLDWRSGKQEALGQLLPVVYDELCRLAAYYLRQERKEHTLQPTALVNEAYLRLVRAPQARPRSTSIRGTVFAFDHVAPANLKQNP